MRECAKCECYWQLNYVFILRGESIKKPKLWNREPASVRSTLAAVAVCSGEFKIYSGTSCIMPRQTVVELRALEWVCVQYPRRFFASGKTKALEEQRVCIKFCFTLEKTFTETFQMLQQSYGEDCLRRTQCHEWYQRFKSDRTSIEDDPKSRRPSTSMDDDQAEKVLACK